MLREGSAIKTRLDKGKKTRFIVLIVLAGAILFLLHHERTVTEADLTKEIRTDLIRSTEMLKAQYSKKGNGAYIDWLDVPLSEEETGNIAAWINSASEADLMKLEHIPAQTSISAGIVFNLRKAEF